MEESEGDRVKQIRESLGQKQPEFAATLTAAAKKRGIRETYDNTMVSKMETGRRDVAFKDAVVIMSVDPKRRPVEWLALGDRALSSTPASGRTGEDAAASLPSAPAQRVDGDRLKSVSKKRKA